MAWIERHGRSHRVRWRENGEVVEAQERLKSEADALNFKATLNSKVESQESSGVDVREYIRQVLVVSELSPRTLEEYERALRLHIEPDVLAQIPVHALTANDMRAFFGRFRGKGATDSTRFLVRRLLSKVFTEALRDGLVTRNPSHPHTSREATGRPLRRVQPGGSRKDRCRNRAALRAPARHSRPGGTIGLALASPTVVP